MTNATTARLFLAALAVSGVTAFAQTNHGNHSTSTHSTSTHAKTTPEMTMTGMSHMGDLPRLSGKAFDRAYLSMMIGHHQGALDMSKAVTARIKDTQVKKWADAVIADQTREINTMTTWLTGMGGIEKKARDAMASEMRGMISPLKTAKDADLAFVKGMLPHHASALDMANLALQRSGDERILKLSRDIIKAQADEMYAFKRWLARNGS